MTFEWQQIRLAHNSSHFRLSSLSRSLNQLQTLFAVTFYSFLVSFDSMHVSIDSIFLLQWSFHICIVSFLISSMTYCLPCIPVSSGLFWFSFATSLLYLACFVSGIALYRSLFCFVCIVQQFFLLRFITQRYFLLHVLIFLLHIAFCLMVQDLFNTWHIILFYHFHLIILHGIFNLSDVIFVVLTKHIHSFHI